MSAAYEYMGGTRDSGFMSTAEMSVVRGIGGVCEMCMGLARGGVWCV